MKSVKFTVEGLTDKNGNVVNIGDIITVLLPAKITGNKDKLVSCVLYCTASNGLMISVVDTSLKGRCFKFSAKWDFWRRIK